MRGSLAGRDADLDRTLAGLHTAGRVLLEGPAGIGKTAVLRAVVDAERDRGTLVLRCDPTESETVLPLAALADLLGPLHASVDDLPAPQREAVRAALLLGDDLAAVDGRALAAATTALLTTAAAGSAAGVLVCVDDAPWLDPPSERALRFALRRVPPTVRVVVARRTVGAVDTPAPLDLDAAGPLERVTLGPLGVGPLHHLVAERFGVSLSRPMITRIAREAGGNPLLAVELTRSVLRLPRLPGPGDDLPVPSSLQDLVDASLATLPPAGRRAVRVAALLTTPRPADLSAADVSPGDLDAAEEVGLVTVDADRVRFAHPTYASAVRAGIPNGVRRRLHAELAGAVADPDERARHLARHTGDPDDAVAAALGAAAARVRARGAPGPAADLYRRAARLSTDDLAATRWRLDALHGEFDSGDYARVAEQIEALTPDLHGDTLAEALLLRALVAFGVDDLPLAAATAGQALAVAAPSSRLAGVIHIHLANFHDQPGEAHRHADAARVLLDGAADRPEGPAHAAFGGSDRELLAAALLLIFLNEVRTGIALRPELLDRALELEAGSPARLAGTVPAIWWKAVDDHDRARRRLEWTIEDARRSGDEPLQHEALQHLAQAELLAGDLERAAAHVAASRELAVQLGTGVLAERWLGGTVDALRGDLVAARAAADAGLAEAAVHDDVWLRRISLELAGVTALAAGRHADAADAFASLAEAVDGVGLVESLTSRSEPDWIEACVAVGDLATADRVLDRLVERHRRLPRPWTTLGIARSRVLIAGARGEDTAVLVEHLLAAREALAADVIPVDRARCLLVAGLAHRRARRRAAARAALTVAVAEFAAMGAGAFQERARAELDRVGGSRDPDALTATERRVADLAAGGATNREIADRLFLAPKTVEANLARIYRKLGIGRRAELAVALAGRPGAQDEGSD